VAAWLEGIAEPGGICVSGRLRQLDPPLRISNLADVKYLFGLRSSFSIWRSDDRNMGGMLIGELMPARAVAAVITPAARFIFDLRPTCCDLLPAEAEAAIGQTSSAWTVSGQSSSIIQTSDRQ